MSGHPHRAEAMASSREKMRRIGHRGGGGGSPFLGMSPHKRPDDDGEQHSYHSHEKQFASHAHGGKAKKRGDRRARGGAVKKAGGGALPYKEREPDTSERYPGGGGQESSAGMGYSPNAAATMGYSDLPDYDPAPTHVPPFRPSGQGMDPEGFRAKMDEDTAAARGGTEHTHTHKHFHVHKKKAGGAVEQLGGRKSELGGEKKNKKPYSHREDMESAIREPSSAVGSWREDAGEKRGGRAKRASGGRIPVSKKEGQALYKRMASEAGAHRSKEDEKWALEEARDYVGGRGHGSEEDIKRGGKASKHARGGRTKKHSGPINITIGMPPQRPPTGGMGAAPIPPVPSPSAGGAAPPPPPPAGGMPPPGGMGGAPPPGGMPPGGNPMQAQQALGAIAGGGGPMGAGMPGLHARGGKVASPGLAKNIGHWKGYAANNSRKNTAQERGATGESRGLRLKTPTGHARGGRTKPDAGAVTGVGREEKASIHRRHA